MPLLNVRLLSIHIVSTSATETTRSRNVYINAYPTGYFLWLTHPRVPYHPSPNFRSKQYDISVPISSFPIKNKANEHLPITLCI